MTDCAFNCGQSVFGLIPAGGLEALTVNLGLVVMVEGVLLRDCRFGWWYTRDRSLATKSITSNVTGVTAVTLGVDGKCLLLMSHQHIQGETKWITT